MPGKDVDCTAASVGLRDKRQAEPDAVGSVADD